jgi:hypothetical protein
MHTSTLFSKPHVFNTFLSSKRRPQGSNFLPALQQCADLPASDIVSPQEWLRKLASSEQDASKNPSNKVLGFWEGRYGNAATVSDAVTTPAGQILETTRTLKYCPALKSVDQPAADGLVSRDAEQ